MADRDPNKGKDFRNTQQQGGKGKVGGETARDPRAGQGGFSDKGRKTAQSNAEEGRAESEQRRTRSFSEEEEKE